MADKKIELGALLYEGRSKQVYAAPGNDLVVIHYNDGISALGGKKKGQIEGKGIINNKLSASFFRLLESAAVPTHFVTRANDREQVCRKVTMIPLKVIVRNTAAGSFAARSGQAEGTDLPEPVVELVYRNAEKGNPFVTKEQAVSLGAAKAGVIDTISELALQANDVLCPFLWEKKLNLVDVKLEFGFIEDNNIVVADEISPDTCRIWDAETNEKLDKDRFRLDLGNAAEAYAKVYEKVGDFRVIYE